jgi:3-oxoacyl-[acyl-carrier-protein] synthase II
MSRPNPSRRVVITGIGAVTPFGAGVAALWSGLCTGASVVGPVTRFPADTLRTRIAAQVPALPLPTGLEQRDAKRMDRFTLFALTAADEAWCQAGLCADDIDPYGAGVVIGSSHGGEETMLEGVRALMSEESRRVSPWLISRMLANMAAAQTAIRYGLRGPSFAIASACATGAHAIGEAAEIIRRGDAEVMLAGASDASITPLTLAGDAAAGALSTRNDEPERASRPFDVERDGFVVGEGAGVLVLEEYGHAVARGGTIIAELSGYGTTTDAMHETRPDESGAHVAHAIRRALEKAGLMPEELDAVFAHATGTPVGDRAEARALQAALGAAASRVPIAALKGSLGHLMGAAGAVQALAVIKALETQTLPPTVNLDTPDVAEFDFVGRAPRPTPLRHVLSNAIGFGGHNVALILSAPDDH